MIIGDKNAFAIDVGVNYQGNQIRKIDVVINNQYVCVDDNSAFVPQFITSLAFDIEQLKKADFNKFDNYFEGLTVPEIHEFILNTRTEGAEEFDLEDDQIYPLHCFLDWGPTTDNISSFLIPKNKEMYLTHQFWREEHINKIEIGVINITKVEIEEIIGTLEKTILILK